MTDSSVILRSQLQKKPRLQTGPTPKNNLTQERKLQDMDTLPELPPKIKTTLEPGILKALIKKNRRELLASPFSVSAYNLLLSLDLLLAEMEVS